MLEVSNCRGRAGRLRYPSPEMPPLASLSGQKLLVTGAAGFIGARVVAAACAAGAEVTALVRPSTSLSRLDPSVRRACAEVLSFEEVRAAVAGASPDIVVHAAGRADWRQDPSLTLPMMALHAMGTAHVLEAARQVGCKRMVLVGSSGEYGDAPNPLHEQGAHRPLDPYSTSKLAATELGLTYHRSFGLPTTVVRPFVVYGPGEPPSRLLPTLLASAARRRSEPEGGEQEAVAFTAGTQLRDFVYVDEVAEGILRAALCPAAPGQVINLGTGVGVRVRDGVELAIEISGRRVRPEFGKLPMRPGEPKELVASTERAMALLGWAPSMGLREGLEAFWSHLCSELRNP